MTATVLIILMILANAIYSVYEVRLYRKTIQDAVNHNERLTSFLYRVRLPREEILRRLRTGSKSDQLSCAVDSEGCTVLFSHWHGASVRYLLTFQESEDGCLIWLDEVQRIQSGSASLRLNSFFIKKMNAEIIPYQEYDPSKHVS